MTIEKNLNGTELTVTIAGRLDTTTAPELETALKESRIRLQFRMKQQLKEQFAMRWTRGALASW